MTNDSTPSLPKVIEIDERKLKDHLGQIVRGTAEEPSMPCSMPKPIPYAARDATNEAPIGGMECPLNFEPLVALS